MVGTGGFEPLTSATRTQRSTRLNYVPLFNEHILTQKKLDYKLFFHLCAKKLSVRKNDWYTNNLICIKIIFA